VSAIVARRRWWFGDPFGAHTRPILFGRVGTVRGPAGVGADLLQRTTRQRRALRQARAQTHRPLRLKEEGRLDQRARQTLGGADLDGAGLGRAAIV
jgi:hypothetical protein